MQIRGAVKVGVLVALVLVVVACAFPGAQALALTGSRAFSFDIGSGEGSGKGQIGPTDPNAVAVGTNGDAFVLDSVAKRVVVFKGEEGVVSEFTAGAGHEFADATGLAVDDSSEAGDPSRGDVYVADRQGGEAHGGAVDRFEPTAGGYRYAGQLSAVAPTGVAVDAKGDVYVAQESPAAVVEFGPKGESLGEITGADMSFLAGIAVPPDGRVLYVVSRARGEAEEPGKVVRFALGPGNKIEGETVIDGGGAYAVATEAGGEAFVIATNSAGFRQVNRYEATAGEEAPPAEETGDSEEDHTGARDAGIEESARAIAVGIDSFGHYKTAIYVTNPDGPGEHGVPRENQVLIGAKTDSGETGEYNFRAGSLRLNGSQAFPQGGMGGVAVNDASHDVYVADRGNNRVEYFSSTGVYVGQFDGSGTFEVDGETKTGAPAADGQFSEPSQIAVDNSGEPLTDPSAGDVYVVDESQGVVDKFSATGEYLGELAGPFTTPRGVTVGPSGNVWVSAYGQTSYEFGNALQNEFIFSFRAEMGKNIAFNAFDNELYGVAGSSGILKYTTTGEFREGELGGLLGLEINGLAADNSSGDLFASLAHSVSVLEAGGGEFKQQPSFGSGDLISGGAAAVDSATGAVYVADGGSDTVAKFSLLPSESAEVPSDLTGTSATLNGTVHPNDEAVVSCQFEYGSEAGVYPHTVPCEQDEAEIGGGIGGVPVTAKVSGLQPGTVYHFRLAASHATGGFSYSGDEVIPIAPAIESEWATGVTSDGATFSAQIDPDGADTAYYFQYGTGEAYGSTAPAPAGDAGTGFGGREVSVHVQGLQPGTTYHYRVVAGNIAPPQAVDGEDHTIVTQPAGGELALPDGRQWELVSPPDKHGASPLWIGTGVPIQASAAGAAITYSTDIPAELEPRGNASSAQVLSTRGPGGWSSHEIATPHEGSVFPAPGRGSEYEAFSSDLSQALLVPEEPSPLLSPEASENTYYLRHDSSCEATPATCYTPLLSTADVAPGVKVQGIAYNHGFDDATPDLSHVLFQDDKEPLTETTPEGKLLQTGETGGLFEWAGGRLQYVSVLPSGEPAEGDRYGGGFSAGEGRGALSSDGARIVWSAKSPEAEGNGTHLYMRDVTDEKTVQLDAPEAGAEGGVQPFYQIANSEGSRVFFGDEAKLTSNSTASGYYGRELDLYECEIAETPGDLSCDLSDLTVDPNSGQHADVQGGVLGASEDGSYIYFVARGELATAANVYGEKAKEGEDNLYMLHYDEPTRKWEEPVFIAGLSGSDEHDWSTGLSDHTAKVSPNGEYLTFMSNRKLTGYDNLDASSDAPDEEVYLYDTATGRLVCPSCDPTGARPVGTEDSKDTELQRVGGGEFSPGTWLAATIQGWTPYADAEAEYQSRYLFNSGRLFFNSDDALVPQDANGTWDVYEYEPPGVGGCQTSSITFSARSGGCVSLVSSGTSPVESGFIDASETGDDVFFLTAASLVAQDKDSAYDIYDAHVCSAAAPCVSSPVSVSPCDTGDSCKAAPTPQPTIFGAPASATFSGAGNAVSSPLPAPRASAPRSLTRAQQLARALRACRRKPKRKRAGCERQARREYGAARSGKSNATRKRGR